MTRSTPVLVHGPGPERERPWWGPIRDRLFETPHRHSLPAGLAIVTFNSGVANPDVARRGHSLGWFERSLEHAEVPFTVLGQGVGAAWTNRMKLELTLDFLAGTSAEYVLGADSSDVLLVGDPGSTLSCLAVRSAGVLFNAEKKPWPKEATEVARFERGVAKGPFRHLNSGMWVGRRAALLEVFQAARRWADRLESRPRSEQICLRYAYRDLHPLVQVDDGCTIFQCLNEVRREIEVDGQRWPAFSWLTGRLPQ